MAEKAVQEGDTVMLAFVMKPGKGWHGYWQNPGDAGQGMRLKWDLPLGWTAGTPLYPTPETLLISGLMNHVYEHDYAVLAVLTLPADARPGSRLPVRVKLDWLACTDQICVPEQAELTLRVPQREAGAANPFDASASPSANAAIAPSRCSWSFADPGCTTKYSAPIVTARSNSPRNAAIDFGRFAASAEHRLIR